MHVPDERSTSATEDDPAATAGPSTRGLLYGELAFAVLLLGSLAAGLGTLNLSVSDAVVIASVPVLIATPRRYWHPAFARVAGSFGAGVLVLLLLGIVLLMFVGGDPIVLAKDAFSYVSFFVALGLLLAVKRPPSLAIPKAALVVAMLMLFGSIVVEGGVRASGFFSDPNLSGNWLACALIALIAMRFPRRAPLRWTLIAIGIYGVILTGSFGALVVLGMGICAALSVRRGLSIPAQAGAILAALIVGLVALPTLGLSISRLQGLEYNRFESTSSGRLDTWTKALGAAAEHPLGMGPGGFAKAGIVDFSTVGRAGETHNDYLAILTDYGVVGLAIWLPLLLVLFVVAEWGRPMFVALAASSLTINALNFRHIWFLTALLIAYGCWDGAARIERTGRAEPARLR